jgi:hypothetical protein
MRVHIFMSRRNGARVHIQISRRGSVPGVDSGDTSRSSNCKYLDLERALTTAAAYALLPSGLTFTTL